MSDEVYSRLAKVLDTLPSGFPPTDDGAEIRLLKKVFTPEQADLFCDLKLHFETPEQIAERTGRPIEGLEEMLDKMWEDGQIFGLQSEGIKQYKMVPWVVGIYEFQLNRLDEEFSKLHEAYGPTFAVDFFTKSPQLFKVLPVEQTIAPSAEIMPYDKVSTIIENGKSFVLFDCVCRKDAKLRGETECNHPTDVCLFISDKADAFYDGHPWKGKPLTKKEAYGVIKRAEEIGLVHNTCNFQKDHYYICNCCGCGCGQLRIIKETGMAYMVNASFYAEIDPELCSACGTCMNERCQVAAIEEEDEVYRVIKERCIGCGLCVSSCPTEAISLIRKSPEQIITPPEDEEAWNDERAKARGMDYDEFK